MKILSTNKRAFFDYQILEKIEAGIALKGAEVKAVKEGKMNLSGSYVVFRNQEAFLINSQIAPYQPNNPSAIFTNNRTRKLLLQKREIIRLSQKIKEKGLTLIPLRVYNKNGLVKVEIGLAKGRRTFDKRRQIKEREIKRTLARMKRKKF